MEYMEFEMVVLSEDGIEDIILIDAKNEEKAAEILLAEHPDLKGSVIEINNLTNETFTNVILR